MLEEGGRVEMKRLRYFLKIAETSSFTHAASALQLTQPTLSHQMQALEREIGAPLFDRSGRAVRLTAQGKVFRAHVERAVKEFESGLTAVAELEGLIHARLSVGVLRSFSTSLLPEVLARFIRTYPGVRLSVRQLSHTEMQKALLDGTLDVAVGHSPAAPRIVAEPLFTDSLALVVGEPHPFYERTRIRFEDLQGLSLVLLGTGFSVRRMIDQCLDRYAVTAAVVMEMNCYEAILATVRCSALGTICAARAIGVMSDLRAIELPDAGLERTTALLWPQDTHRPAAARVLADMIRESYSESAPGKAAPAARKTRRRRRA